MPYRQLYEEVPREALLRLAELGMRRSNRCDRPLEPPPRAQRKVKFPFPVSEDAANPVNEHPGMTNILLIRIEVRAFAAADVELVRHAVWSIHPLFETWYHHESLAPPIPRLIIEIPGSKIARPGTWIQVVIEEILPALHAFSPIRAVQFGREPTSWR